MFVRGGAGGDDVGKELDDPTRGAMPVDHLDLSGPTLPKNYPCQCPDN